MVVVAGWGRAVIGVAGGKLLLVRRRGHPVLWAVFAKDVRGVGGAMHRPRVRCAGNGHDHESRDQGLLQDPLHAPRRAASVAIVKAAWFGRRRRSLNRGPRACGHEVCRLREFFLACCVGRRGGIGGKRRRSANRGKSCENNLFVASHNPRAGSSVRLWSGGSPTIGERPSSITRSCARR